jgi:hypothetical protein
VKDKQNENNRIDCAPSIQSSTESSNHQSQPDPSLGNNIGGKSRNKREVVDVLVDDEHEHHDDIIQIIDKRVLVNITIGMDKGIGTQQHEVYHLQVAVPLKNNSKAYRDMFAYDVHQDESFPTDEKVSTANYNATTDETSTTTQSDDFSSSAPCDCDFERGLILTTSNFEREITATRFLCVNINFHNDDAFSMACQTNVKFYN